MDKKLTILVSGGLDSVIAYYYALAKGYKEDEIFPLWLDLGQPYNWKEEEVIDRLPFKVNKMHIDLVREEFDNVPTPESDKQIIPGRNLMFAVIGASFGKTVWLSALDGERNPFAKERDKSEKFFADATDLLTYVFNILRPETVLETPFRNMTKQEAVAWALDNGVSEELLMSTSTCYDDKEKACGECPTCFKRWVAMYGNGIYEEHSNANPPWLVFKKGSWHNEYVKTLIKCLENKEFEHYSEKRCRETLDTLDLFFIREDLDDWRDHLEDCNLD